MRNLAVVACVLLACWPLANWAGEAQDYNVVLQVKDAISRAAGQHSSLELELQVRDGKWQPDFVRGRGGNQGRHVGVVKSGAIEGAKMTLAVEVRVKPDLWVGGGEGKYELQLERSADGKTVSGSYTGAFTVLSEPKPTAPQRGARAAAAKAPPPDVPAEFLNLLKKGAAAKTEPEAEAKATAGETFKVSGNVSGRIDLPWPGTVANFVPVQPGEHPRLIFRKADVEKLRKQAETPAGKAIMERFLKVIDYTAHNDGAKFDSWPGIGFGFAYQMTGDKKYADRARALIQAKFFDRGPQGGQDIHHGPPLQGLALTFDLVYDTLDEAFRQKCIDEIWQRAQECATGTFGGGGMGGTNWAYWSNHNGVRSSGAGLGALAVLHEKTAQGKVLDKEALAIADEAAFDAKGWLRDGTGGGAWFMEGMFYKGMTMVRGQLHFNHAYAQVTGKKIYAAGLGDFLITGYFLEADPGRLFDTGGARDGIAASYGIDDDNLIEVIWTIGLTAVPDSMMPGMKWLLDRNVGLQGSKTFGLERACYAPYLLAAYPFDVQEKPPSECFPWISPDPINGHWVFRPAWKDANDILMTLNMLSHVRGSCHYERVGPLCEWRLLGLGQTWLNGNYLPPVKGKEKMVGESAGMTTKDWRVEGKTAVITWDTAWAYAPLIERARGSKTAFEELAKEKGALGVLYSTVGARADFGIHGERHLAVDCSEASGAPLLIALLEDLTDRKTTDAPPAPAEFTWKLPLDAKGATVSAEGQTFTVTKGDAILAGIALGGGPVNPKDASVAVQGGKLLVVMVMQKGGKPEFKVDGQGVAAKITVGKRTVRFADGRLALE